MISAINRSLITELIQACNQRANSCNDCGYATGINARTLRRLTGGELAQVIAAGGSVNEERIQPIVRGSTPASGPTLERRVNRMGVIMHSSWRSCIGCRSPQTPPDSKTHSLDYRKTRREVPSGNAATLANSMIEAKHQDHRDLRRVIATYWDGGELLMRVIDRSGIC